MLTAPQTECCEILDKDSTRPADANPALQWRHLCVGGSVALCTGGTDGLASG